MARQPRILLAGGVYHVFVRGNAGQLIFGDVVDRRRFLEMLAEAAVRYRWRVLGYCLMGNHYHLVLLTEEPSLAHGMRQLNGRYGQWRNRRQGSLGHVFQGRYGAVLIQEGAVLRWVLRYVARNPVEAGLVTAPTEWPWSSHRAVLGVDPPGLVDRVLVLGEFGEDTVDACRSYRDFVDGEPESASEVGSHPIVVGDDAFTRLHLDALEPCAEFPARTLCPSRPSLASFGSLEGREALTIALGAGYTMRELASHLGCSVSTVHRRARAGS